MSENLRYIAGHITISRQLYEQLAEQEQVFKDIQSGKREWDPSKVDWDAIEQAEWDYEHGE